jgi:hypothetical protein
MGSIGRTCGRVAAMVVLVCVLASGAQAAPGLIFGFTDNRPLTNGVQSTSVERALGATATSYTLVWHTGETRLSQTEMSQLAHGVVSASGMRVILSVRTNGAETPLTPTARDQFCSYARNAVESFPTINDVVIGNEPNSSYFWRPQYNADGTSASPAAYEALLARCYDVLHAFRPAINVAAPATGPHGNDNPWAVSNISHSPTSFIIGMAAAYRASGRTTRIFDTVVHHPYGDWNNERPYLMHGTDQSIGEGDWSKLVDLYQSAFADTAQPVPGQCFAGSPCVPIWYLELGFQTSVPRLPGYFGTENVLVVPDASIGEAAGPSPPADSPGPDQATQLGYALRLAYCQPYVEAAFNFLLRDDANLAGYQSGLYLIDGSPKAAVPALAAQVAALHAGAVSCAPPTRPTGLIARVNSLGDVELSWSPSSSSIGVSGYSISRNGRFLTTTTDPTFIDTTVGRGTQDSYVIRAFDAAGTVSAPPGASASVSIPRKLITASRTGGSAARAGQCVVPKIRGKRLKVAKRLLARSGCRLGKVHRMRTVPARLAVVRKQSPRAGRHLRRGARVSITLGRRLHR